MVFTDVWLVKMLKIAIYQPPTTCVYRGYRTEHRTGRKPKRELPPALTAMGLKPESFLGLLFLERKNGGDITFHRDLLTVQRA